MIENFELHQSSLVTYLWCPRRFYYGYVGRVHYPASSAAYLGSCIHYVAAELMRRRLRNEELFNLDDACDIFAKEFKEAKDYTISSPGWSGVLNFDEDEAKDLIRVGRQVLTCAWPHWLEIKPAMAETVLTTTIDTPVGALRLGGKLDLLDDRGVYIDFKTAARSWPKGKEHKALQATFYSLLIGGPMKTEYHVLVKGPIKYFILPTERTQADINFLVEDIIRPVAVQLEAGAFPCCAGEEGAWYCGPKWCDYWNACPRSGTTAAMSD